MSKVLYATPSPDDFNRKFLHAAFMAAHEPTLKDESFCYLLGSNGSIHFSRGRDGFLKDTVAQIEPGYGESIGSLAIPIPSEYEMDGVSAVLTTKRVAIRLRDLFEALLTPEV